MTDRDVNSLAAEEQAEAERRLAALFYDRVLAVALSRTRDREIARDLTQDALLAVITALRAGQLRSNDKLGAFVYGTVRNIINNHFRAAGRVPPIEPLEPEHGVTEDADPLEEHERRRVIREALGELNAQDKRIVLFTLVDGLKPGEIARRLGLSDEVVRTRKSRAVRRITERVNTWFGMSQKQPHNH